MPVRDLSDHTQYYVKLSKKFWKYYFESSDRISTAMVHKFPDNVASDFACLCDIIQIGTGGGYIEYIKFVEQYEDNGTSHIIGPDGQDYEISLDGSFKFFATSKSFYNTNGIRTGIIKSIKKYAKIKNTEEPVIVVPFRSDYLAPRIKKIKYEGERYIERDTNAYEIMMRVGERADGRSWQHHVEYIEKNGWTIPVLDKATAKYFGLAKYTTFAINQKFLEQDN